MFVSWSSPPSTAASGIGSTAPSGSALSCSVFSVARQAGQLRRCGRRSTICSLDASPSTIADRTGSQRSHSAPDSIVA